MSAHTGPSPGVAPGPTPPVADGRHRSLLWILGLLVAGNVWFLFHGVRPVATVEAKHQFWIVSHAEYSAQARLHAFLKLVEARNTEWRSAKLHGLNFTGLWLADTDLHAANFTGDSFAKATLAGAHLQQCVLQQTDFTGADCSHADFSGVDFYRALLVETRFSQSWLRGAGLQEAQAREANFAQADLSHAFLLMANCSNANFVGANLTGASLEAAILKNANLHLTQLADSNLKDADFTGANWWRAQGLSPEQIAMLEAKFTPAEDSDLHEDYVNWATSTVRKPVVTNARP